MKTIACWILLAASLAAQTTQPLTPRKALLRAIVIEEDERNPEEAKARLEKLATGVQPASSDQVQNRTLNALTKLHKDDAQVWEHGIEDLVFIGDAAVRELCDQLANEQHDRLFITRGVKALIQIGTERAAASFESLIERGDHFLQKAALDAPDERFLPKLTKPMSKALAVFFQSKLWEIKKSAVSALVKFVPAEDLIAVCGDYHGEPSEELRAEAYRTIAFFWGHMRHDGNNLDASAEMLRPLLEEGVKREELPALRCLAVLCNFRPLKPLFVRSLPAIRFPPGQQPSVFGVGAGAPSLPSIAPGELVAEMLAVAPEIAKLPDGDWRKVVLTQCVQLAMNNPTKDLVPAAFELLQLGFDRGELTRVIVRHAEPKDVVSVARGLSRSVSQEEVLRWMLNLEVPPAVLVDLKPEFERAVTQPRSPLRSLGRAIARIRSADAISTLLAACKRSPAYFETYGAWHLIEASRAPVMPEAEAALVEALLLPGTVPTSPDQRVAGQRNRIFHRLVQIGSANAVPLYAKAYEVGIAQTAAVGWSDGEPTDQNPMLRGLTWLAPMGNLASISGLPDQRHTRYDDRAIARIFDACLATNRVDAWTDVAGLGGSLGQVPDAVLEVLCKRAIEMPSLAPLADRSGVLAVLINRAYAEGKPRAPAVHALIEHTLAKGESRDRELTAHTIWEAAVLPERSRALLSRMLDDEATVGSALSCLRKWNAKDQVAQIEPLLKSEKPGVRNAAASALVKQLGAGAIEKITPNFTDPQSAVRAAACFLARDELPDRKFVPALLDRLRDEDSEVRGAAKQALERIQFLEEQHTFWQRLSKDSPLATPNAAEALVQQTKSQDKRIRLAAIDSLGTLAVPETLPILIQLMQDQDKEIAERARVAIDKVNAAKK